MQQTIFNKLSREHDIILLLSDIEEMKHIIKNSKGKKGKLNNKLKHWKKNRRLSRCLQDEGGNQG